MGIIVCILMVSLHRASYFIGYSHSLAQRLFVASMSTSSSTKKTVTYQNKVYPVVFFSDNKSIRKWFDENGSKEKDIWIGFYKQSSLQSSVTYSEALDTSLCYGWIDGIRKRLDEQSYCNRFTPRKAKSNWSEVNIRRFAGLQESSLVQEAGSNAYNSRVIANTKVEAKEINVMNPMFTSSVVLPKP